MDVRGWRQFCREHGLYASLISLLHRGVANVIRGWRLLEKPPVEYRFADPSGTLHVGIFCVKDFAEAHGIDRKGLSRVHTGDRITYKGWRKA
jgi:hypothetical protein